MESTLVTFLLLLENTLTKATYSREVIWAYSSRGNYTTWWQEADTEQEEQAESLHIQLQAGSRESKLGVSEVFELSKATPK